ncbi:hypothetical protein ACHAW5_003264 [Stephanodiscus triporus]|uniref:Uncharacterized protein n=1 Tax=Stephanodiscus triporus TaxID=2934178 RepID=A0ABD3P1A7_9STRA
MSPPSARTNRSPASPRRTHAGGDFIHINDCQRDCGSTTTTSKRADSVRMGFFPHSLARVVLLDSPTASHTGSSSGRDSPATPESATATMTMTRRIGLTDGSKSTPAEAGGDSPALEDVDLADSPATAAGGASPGSRGGGAHGDIDHTALLLGFVDESGDDEGSHDDEREWNATFSLDELDAGGAGRCGAKGGAASSTASEEEDAWSSPATYCSRDEHKDEGGPVLLEASTKTTRSQQRPPRPVANFTRSSTNDEKQQPRPTAYVRTCSNGTKGSPSRPSTIGSDAWRREEEEKLAYYDGTPRLKKYDSFEHRKKMAAMTALALKERASSALVSKAARAKEKVKERIIKKNSSLGDSGIVRGTARQQDLDQGQHLEQHKGMEITTFDHDEIDSLSQLSEVTDDKNVYTSVTKSLKSKLSLSHAKLSIERIGTKSSFTSPKISQIASTNLKASKSAVLDMIKDPLLRNFNADSAQEYNVETMTELAATSTTDGTFSLLNRLPGSNMAIKTRQRLAVPSYVKDEVASVFSMDGDIVSNAPNSEGPSSVPLDANCSQMAGMSGRLAHTMITPHHSFSMPRTPSSKKSGKSGANSQSIGNVDADITPPKNNLTRNAAHHGLLLPVSPPAIATCLSNISSRTGAVSCIDASGFLISPAASVDRGWDGAASTAVSSEGTFDPNSFLFLSPLSNNDFDEPDYGMPELLSRSNRRNAVALENAGPHPGPPEDASSMMTLVSPTVAISKRLSRVPQSQSPRLLPLSSKKLSPGKIMIKKLKIVGGRNSICPNKTSPTLNRAFTSSF